MRGSNDGRYFTDRTSVANQWRSPSCRPR